MNKKFKIIYKTVNLCGGGNPHGWLDLYPMYIDCKVKKWDKIDCDYEIHSQIIRNMDYEIEHEYHYDFLQV